MERNSESESSLENQTHPHVSMQSIVDWRILSQSPLLNKLNNEVVLSMLSVMRRDIWPRGYTLTSAENTNTRFYLILKGRIKICRSHSENGRELTLFLLGPGDGFNVLNMIDGSNEYFINNTLDEVEVVSAPVATWLEWLDQYPVLRTSMAEVAADHIQRLSELACELALDDAMTRLIHLLVRYFNNSSYGLNLIQDLPQEELANMIGSVRPVVSRLLGELKRDGLIYMDGGEIHVRDLNLLLNKASKRLVSLSK